MGELEDENAELRRLLWEQWEENHFEHCGRGWPHPQGEFCGWPLPAILKERQPPEKQPGY